MLPPSRARNCPKRGKVASKRFQKCSKKTKMANTHIVVKLVFCLFLKFGTPLPSEAAKKALKMGPRQTPRHFQKIVYLFTPVCLKVIPNNCPNPNTEMVLKRKQQLIQISTRRLLKIGSQHGSQIDRTHEALSIANLARGYLEALVSKVAPRWPKMALRWPKMALKWSPDGTR